MLIYTIIEVSKITFDTAKIKRITLVRAEMSPLMNKNDHAVTDGTLPPRFAIINSLNRIGLLTPEKEK